MFEFRCTRPELYGPGCPGHLDVTARNGHYIRAKTAADAIAQMNVQYPGEWIQVQLWRDENGKLVA